MSERWLRLYDGVVHDPKLQRLPGDVFKGLINLWCIASANGGSLPSVEDIAFTLHTSTAKAAKLIATLREAELIDDIDGQLQPHNWEGRQFKSDVSTGRVKQFRERRRNVSGNGDETFQETPNRVSGNAVKRFHETPPDTEQNRDRAETDSVPNGTAFSVPRNDANQPKAKPDDPEKRLFDRGKQVLGGNSGGLIKKLLLAKGNSADLALSAIEAAANKSDPREYIGAVLKAATNGAPPDAQVNDDGSWNRWAL